MDGWSDGGSDRGLGRGACTAGANRGGVAQSGRAQWKRKAQLRLAAALAGAAEAMTQGWGDSGLRYGRENMK